jgi:hypothetical protein
LDTAVSNLRDTGTGALADRVSDPAAPGLLRYPLFPLEANSHMARVLVRLFWLSGERRGGEREATCGHPADVSPGHSAFRPAQSKSRRQGVKRLAHEEL